MARSTSLQLASRPWLLALAAVLLGCGASTPSVAPGARPEVTAPPAAAATTQAPAATGTAQPEWDRLVAAARAEGKLPLAVPPGPQYEPAIREAFAQTFLGVQVEM